MPCMVQTQGFQLIANRVVNFRFATTADQVVNLRFATRVHVTNNNKSCKCCVKCVKNPGLQRLQVYNAPGLQFANAKQWNIWWQIWGLQFLANTVANPRFNLQWNMWLQIWCLQFIADMVANPRVCNVWLQSWGLEFIVDTVINQRFAMKYVVANLRFIIYRRHGCKL